MVTLAGLRPGSALDTAVALADALDARRVPLTLLAGSRPHPEVVAWAAARRRVGDAVLLHGTRPDQAPAARPYRRLPAHEAGLRLAAALRTTEALGLGVDGFAAPGWAASAGTRHALAAVGLDVLVDERGAHLLGVGGDALSTCPGAPVAPAVTVARRPGPTLRSRLGRGRGGVGGLSAPAVSHLAESSASPSARDALLAAVDTALEAGGVPRTAASLLAEFVPGRVRPVPARSWARRADDPEQWSITA